MCYVYLYLYFVNFSGVCQCARLKPHSISSRPFPVQVRRMAVSWKVGSAILVGSHLLRGVVWGDGARALALVQSELYSFRAELVLSEELLRRSNTALDSCLSKESVRAESLKFLAIVVGELVVIVVVWFWFHRKKQVPVAVVESPAVCDSGDDSSPDSGKLPPIADVAKGVAIRRTGPLRPSDIRRSLNQSQ